MLFRTLAWYGGVPRRHCGRQRAPGVWSTGTISLGLTSADTTINVVSLARPSTGPLHE